MVLDKLLEISIKKHSDFVYFKIREKIFKSFSKNVLEKVS